jgi:hypothetical protein
MYDIEAIHMFEVRSCLDTEKRQQAANLPKSEMPICLLGRAKKGEKRWKLSGALVAVIISRFRIFIFINREG